MRPRSDPALEDLRRANPLPESAARGWAVSEEGREVAARVREAGRMDSPAPVRPRRQRARLVLVVAAAMLALAAATVALTRTTATPEKATCFDRLDLRGSFATIDLKGRSPVDACSEEWTTFFDLPIPARMTACVLNEGGTGVFPYPASMDGDEGCASVGLAVLGAG